jgi:hypothetical protein
MGTPKKKTTKPRATKPTKVRPDPNIFKPTKYPACATCETPYVLRLGFVLKPGGWESGWLYQRDCKHKKSTYKVIGL